MFRNKNILPTPPEADEEIVDALVAGIGPNGEEVWPGEPGYDEALVTAGIIDQAAQERYEQESGHPAIVPHQPPHAQ